MKTPETLSPRQALQAKCNGSRMNLLLVVAFSVINIILLVTNSDSYFLFSAFIPYYIVTIGMLFCGKFPEEYYEMLSFSETDLVDSSFFVVCLVAAFVIVALYLVSWIFSRKNKGGWLIFALVLFVIDTLVMFAISGIALDSIIDIVFHIWVIISLAQGINSCSKLKKMPPEEIEIDSPAQYEENRETSKLN